MCVLKGAKLNSRQIFSGGQIFVFGGTASHKGSPNTSAPVLIHPPTDCTRHPAPPNRRHSQDMSTSAELASAATAAAKIIEEAPFAAASMPALVKYLDLQVRSSNSQHPRTEIRTEHLERPFAQRTRTHCSPGSQAGRNPSFRVATLVQTRRSPIPITRKHPNTQTRADSARRGRLGRQPVSGQAVPAAPRAVRRRFCSGARPHAGAHQYAADGFRGSVLAVVGGNGV